MTWEIELQSEIFLKPLSSTLFQFQYKNDIILLRSQLYLLIRLKWMITYGLIICVISSRGYMAILNLEKVKSEADCFENENCISYFMNA